MLGLGISGESSAPHVLGSLLGFGRADARICFPQPAPLIRRACPFSACPFSPCPLYNVHADLGLVERRRQLASQPIPLTSSHISPLLPCISSFPFFSTGLRNITQLIVAPFSSLFHTQCTTHETHAQMPVLSPAKRLSFFPCYASFTPNFGYGRSHQDIIGSVTNRSLIFSFWIKARYLGIQMDKGKLFTWEKVKLHRNIKESKS